MCIERKTPVQNDTEEMWSNVNQNFPVANEGGRLPSGVIRPSWKETCLIFVSVQI